MGCFESQQRRGTLESGWCWRWSKVWSSGIALARGRVAWRGRRWTVSESECCCERYGIDVTWICRSVWDGGWVWWAEEPVEKGDACNIAKHKLCIKAIGAGATDARMLTQIKESARRMMTDTKTRMEGQDFLDYHHMCLVVTDLRAKGGSLVKTMPFPELLEKLGC